MTASASQQRPGPPDSSKDGVSWENDEGVSGRFDPEHQVWESGSFTHKTIFFPLKMVIFHMILLDLPSFSSVRFKPHGKDIRNSEWGCEAPQHQGATCAASCMTWRFHHELWDLHLALPSTVKTFGYPAPLTACQLLLISSRHSLIRQTYIQNNVCYDYYHHTIRHNHNAKTKLPIFANTQHYTILHNIT